MEEMERTFFVDNMSLYTYFERLASLTQANADPSVINCLHNLSRRIATVLQHEERRCQYLTREAKLILALQDEVSAMADGKCSCLVSMGLLWLMTSWCCISRGPIGHYALIRGSCR